MHDTAKEDYRKWIFEGNCPCCFPYWAYGWDVTASDVWLWQDEMKAWDVHAEINQEYEEES